jgi:hypothetical protein
MGGNSRKKNQVEIKRLLLGLSFFVTFTIFLSIFIIGGILNNNREQYIDKEIQQMFNEFQDMQVFSLILESYGSEMACLAIEGKLKKMDYSIWSLGEKIDKYRSASEEFIKDSYYLEQKKIFNENQVYYYLLLNKMVDECNLSKEIMLFFYRNSEDCKKCDDQSFILSDINEDDNDLNQEIAIFSFDMDLNLTTLNLLESYYDLTPDGYPCVLVKEKIYCGIQDKNIIMDNLCNTNKRNLQICKDYLMKRFN